MKSSYLRKREKDSKRRQRIIAGKIAYPTIGERLCTLMHGVKYAGMVTSVGCIAFGSLGVLKYIPTVYAQEYKDEIESSSVELVVKQFNHGLDGAKVYLNTLSAERAEDYYTSPTTHDALSSEITSYNVTVGAYDYETAIYGRVYDERITEGQTRLVQGNSVTLEPRAGYILEITNTNEGELENGGLYEDLIEMCSVTGIYVDVDKCGYFTINGKNVMKSTTVSDLQRFLGVALATNDNVNYTFSNEYVNMSFMWDSEQLKTFSVTTTTVMDNNDAYPVVRGNIDVINPKRTVLQEHELDSLRVEDVNDGPLVLGGYSLGNWTTEDMVAKAFGEPEDESFRYVVGNHIVQFVFNDNYLHKVVVESL